MQRKSVESGSLTRSDVLAALNVAKPAVGKGLFVPVLSHFCFNGRQVVACDDAVTIGVQCELPLNCAVPADLTLKLLNSLTSDSIKFEQHDTHVQVVCGKSKLRLPALPKTSFVYKLEDKDESITSFSITPDFLAGLSKCLVSVGNDPTHPAQMGVTMVGGDRPCLYSTDNVTMSRFKLGDVELPHAPIIIPTLFCQLLLAMSKAFADEDLEVYVFESSVLVLFGGVALLQSKLIAVENALDFGRVFAAKTKTVEGDFVSLPPAWDSSFMRAASVIDPQHPSTQIDLDSEGRMVITSKSAVGEAEDVLQVEGEGSIPLTTFNIDPNHVLRASKVAAKVGFAKGALVLKDGDFTHLISHCVS